MAVLATRVTVGTSATRVDSTFDTGYALTTLMIRCPTATLFVGGPGVTTSTGFQVGANEAFEWDLRAADALYAVMAVATECHVIQRNGEINFPS